MPILSRLTMTAAAAAAAAIALAVPKPGFAETNMLFILDGSNSMWGQVEGVAKIKTAQDVLADLVADLPKDTKVGLMVYGHRSRESCDDIEILSSIGADGPAELVKKIRSIQPTGKTPIANALFGSLIAFSKFEGQNNHVVLISDGIETCGGDVCMAASVIANANIKPRVHVVGFDVGEEERDQLQCVALAGGGTYYDTTTAKEFRRAIGSIVNDNWVEVLMDTTTLLATFALLAFLVERLTNAMAILFAFSSAWRQHFDVSAAADPDKRIRNDRNRRIALFLVGAAVAIVGALVAQINLLGELGLDAVPQRAGEVVTGLLIASGAEPIRELIQQRARGRDEPPQTTPIQVSGTLVIQQSPSARGENDEKER